MAEYQNLDGVKAEPTSPDYVDYLNSNGWSKVIPLRGKVGCTELGMHTRKCEHIGIVAFVREDNEPDKAGYYSGYAYALLHDGSILDGCFYRFLDGNFSLS